jgi:hypothetical protein
MKTLRRILSVAAIAIGVTGLASADTVISFTVTVPATTTDLNNLLKQITSWNPGGTGGFNAVASDATWAYGGTAATGFTTGVTMASLNAANTTYTLQSYDVLVKSTLTGSFSATATTDGTSGTVHLDSYNAVSLGSTMSALTIHNDPSNDLFTSGGNPPGGGPDPTSSTTAFGPLSNGTSTGTISVGTKSNSVDLGDFESNGGPPSGHSYTPITTSLTDVSGTSPLNFYFSTLTSTDFSFTGGNANGAQATNVAETLTIVYDYTSAVGPSAPEPATFALMGGSLIGLGLLGKRLKKS